TGSTLSHLAAGYLAASAGGVFISSVILAAELRRQGVLHDFRLRDVSFPFKDIFSFAIPMLTTDLVIIAMHSADALMLGYFYGTTEVGIFRVILPLAMLNRTVMTSFAMLYTPTASRLFARNDIAGINQLYWRTTIWLCALTFPLFAATFALSTPLTVLFFGERYVEAGPLLAILAFAYYVDSAFGFNGVTLKVLGCYRRIVTINLLAAVINVAICLLLIPRFGALGAAWGTAISVLIFNVMKQVAMGRVHPIASFAPRYATYFVLLGAAALGLFAVQQAPLHLFLKVVVVTLIAGGILWVSRRHVDLHSVFPEAARLRQRFAAVFSS
ncbi:MAG TPA: oligosaccharide flippase family protein, partial [Terriglobales bacterium]|nr:oligosaccharide flippase family protein [Terriglobales bacterium]